MQRTHRTDCAGGRGLARRGHRASRRGPARRTGCVRGRAVNVTPPLRLSTSARSRTRDRQKVLRGSRADRLDSIPQLSAVRNALREHVCVCRLMHESRSARCCRRSPHVRLVKVHPSPAVHMRSAPESLHGHDNHACYAPLQPPIRPRRARLDQSECSLNLSCKKRNVASDGNYVHTDSVANQHGTARDQRDDAPPYMPRRAGQEAPDRQQEAFQRPLEFVHSRISSGIGNSSGTGGGGIGDDGGGHLRVSEPTARSPARGWCRSCPAGTRRQSATWDRRTHVSSGAPSDHRFSKPP